MKIYRKVKLFVVILILLFILFIQFSLPLSTTEYSPIRLCSVLCKTNWVFLYGYIITAFTIFSLFWTIIAGTRKDENHFLKNAIGVYTIGFFISFTFIILMTRPLTTLGLGLHSQIFSSETLTIASFLLLGIISIPGLFNDIGNKKIQTFHGSFRAYDYLYIAIIYAILTIIFSVSPWIAGFSELIILYRLRVKKDDINNPSIKNYVLLTLITIVVAVFLQFILTS